MPIWTMKFNFYPRPPRGGRRKAIPCWQSRSRFLSTPSARRATRRSWQGVQLRSISIHALREEGDDKHALVIKLLKIFLSTPSARRATTTAFRTTTTPRNSFLSTPSARRATYIDNLYFGDLLGLLCAVCFTGHILAVDHFNDCDSVKISCIQFITNGVLSLICMAIFEQPAWSDLAAAWFPILYAGIFSSGIAYTLQIAGQKYADPAVASIVMSLESVFAVLGGFVVLHEVLAPREIVGCVLVFTAVILAQVPQMRK